jgi:hypothetical protein
MIGTFSVVIIQCLELFGNKEYEESALMDFSAAHLGSPAPDKAHSSAFPASALD